MYDSQQSTVKESLNNMLYDYAVAVTPNDSSDISDAPFVALYVGVGGDVSLDLNNTGSAVVFKNLASGQLLPVVFDRVYSTSTTATDLVALK